MATPKASERRLSSSPAAIAAMAEPPPPSTSTAANCALPAKTNSENADACQVASPASAAAMPKATPNGVTARAIESA
jgi:hypothetical protein